ncbi:MAG TPA: hypothetical protein VNT81_00260 [Vicinamibacterales bacterium]|nr:hypothetical protein [Vicinamibacterales bacterium]
MTSPSAAWIGGESDVAAQWPLPTRLPVYLHINASASERVGAEISEFARKNG